MFGAYSCCVEGPSDVWAFENDLQDTQIKPVLAQIILHTLFEFNVAIFEWLSQVKPSVQQNLEDLNISASTKQLQVSEWRLKSDGSVPIVDGRQLMQ